MHKQHRSGETTYKDGAEVYVRSHHPDRVLSGAVGKVIGTALGPGFDSPVYFIVDFGTMTRELPPGAIAPLGLRKVVQIKEVVE